jgi:hypothetical protein
VVRLADGQETKLVPGSSAFFGRSDLLGPPDKRCSRTQSTQFFSHAVTYIPTTSSSYHYRYSLIRSVEVSATADGKIKLTMVILFSVFSLSLSLSLYICVPLSHHALQYELRTVSIRPSSFAATD